LQEKNDFKSVFKLGSFDDKARKSLIETLSEMRDRFALRSEIKRQNDATLFVKKLDQFVEQIAPIIRDPRVPNKELFVSGIFGHLNGAVAVSEIKPESRANFAKKEKSKFKLREDLLKPIRAILVERTKLAKALNLSLPIELHTSIALELTASIDTKGAKMLEDVVAHIEKLNDGTAHLREGEKPGPKRNNLFEGFLKGAYLEFAELLINQKYTIQPLPILNSGKTDLDFFERQYEAVTGRPKLQRNQYYVSPTRLLANGYYLSGMTKDLCKERHLRKVLNGFKETMGEDAEAWSLTKPLAD
jgi:hypothetical protein